MNNHYPTLGDFLQGHDFSNGVVMILIVVVIFFIVTALMKKVK